MKSDLGISLERTLGTLDTDRSGVRRRWRECLKSKLKDTPTIGFVNESWSTVRDSLVHSPVQRVSDIASVHSTGLYAWWDEAGRLSSLYPVGFPDVDPALPLYVGLAKDDTLASRCYDTHVAPKTRRSTLRRSLSALLAHQLDLLDGAIAHPKVKFSLSSEGDSRLTAWMLTNLRLTWVPHPQPGVVERDVIDALVPPLNDRFAHRADYWRFMKQARQEFHRSVPALSM